jgi:DNA-binding protein H-NS
MNTSLVRIQAQIEKLQKKAAAIRAKEVKGVVDRIKEAIAHYDLTPEVLFGAAAPATKSRRKGAAKKAKKPASPVKYRDAAGHTWTGRGKRPNWFKAALAEGKRLEDLLVK